MHEYTPRWLSSGTREPAAKDGTDKTDRTRGEGGFVSFVSASGEREPNYSHVTSEDKAAKPVVSVDPSKPLSTQGGAALLPSDEAAEDAPSTRTDKTDRTSLVAHCTHDATGLEKRMLQAEVLDVAARVGPDFDPEHYATLWRRYHALSVRPPSLPHDPRKELDVPSLVPLQRNPADGGYSQTEA